MERAIQTVLVGCLGVRKAEEVLILTDPARRPIADALVEGARELESETVLMEMIEREMHGNEPPDFVAAAMRECDVLIAPTTKSLSHTEARRAACANGVRAATMPNITEEMLIRTMGADYSEVRRRAGALAGLLTEAREVRVVAEGGTSATFVVDGRQGVADDGDLTAPGSFGNLPAGEGFVAPVEGKTSGRIVFDGSIWPLGLLEEPLVVDVEDGYAASVSGSRADEFRSILEPYGREALAVAELGIGANDKAKLTGNVLEDEKIMGTIHVAFGDNHTFGGTIRVSSHQDGVVLNPTVTIDSEVVLEGGRLLV